MAVNRAKSAAVVQPHHMIRMRVGKQNGINVADVFPKNLRPQVRGGVDQYSNLFRLNVDR